jgi:hypothetical protein
LSLNLSDFSVPLLSKMSSDEDDIIVNVYGDDPDEAPEQSFEGDFPEIVENPVLTSSTPARKFYSHISSRDMILAQRHR